MIHTTPGGPGSTAPANGRRVIVGIGELAVSARPEEVIVTYALGSCVAVCVFDATAGVAGMLHFLLPDACINTRRAIEQPAAFGDTGIPLLLKAAARLGFQKDRATVRLIGGAELANVAGCGTGRRNVLAARTILWRHGLFIESQDVGGGSARTVHLTVGNGRVQIFSGREQIKEM